MSLVVIPYTFNPNTLAQSAQVNANFTAIAAVLNGSIDNTNIGPAGIYASQIIPTTTAQATFGGGTQKYIFPGPALAGPAYGNTALASLAFQWLAAAGTGVLGASSGITVEGVVASLATIGVGGASPVVAFDTAGDLGVLGNIIAGANITAGLGITASGVIAGSGGGIVPPAFNASGVGVASTLHIVMGTATFTTAATVAVTLSGAAQFTSGATYVVVAGGNTATPFYAIASVSQTASGFTLVNYNYPGTGAGFQTATLPNPTVVPWLAIGV
jgi:hypothetical protein